LSNHKTANCLAIRKTPFKAPAPVTAFFSKGARTHKDPPVFVSTGKGCSEKVKRSSNTENRFSKLETGF
jgi:hypothetical protein